MYKSNKFCDILEINKGITAIIGSGGKTSLMMRLAEELCGHGRTVICTTTHIMRPEGIPTVETEEELKAEFERQERAAAAEHGRQDERGRRPVPVCIGTPAEDARKLTVPSVSFERLTELAEDVIVEADGARRMPLKCHAAHEPVIPENTDRVIWVTGLSGIGKKVSEAVHRPDLFKEYTGLGPDDTVTAEAVAKATAAEAGRNIVTDAPSENIMLFINQADTEADTEKALALAKELRTVLAADRAISGKEAEGRIPDIRIFAGSVKNGHIRVEK
ncbi:MAG: putative selenium-dependent hydroxylase accessory protein YqeC [Lachnospiraceae bacterium]|nr:putative selenium-dependent hydroxylase accessory protein YqeC [Lachnospiraceae bacterium]